jgi:porphobilinogen synthase
LEQASTLHLSHLTIATMPGVVPIAERRLAHEIEAVARDGICSTMMFGISHHRNAAGSDACDPDGLVARTVWTAKQAAHELAVIDMQFRNCIIELGILNSVGK